MKVDKSWVGKKVRALDEDAFAPCVGAVGTVVKFDDADKDTNMHCQVHWNFSRDCMNMWANDDSIELVEDDSTLMPYDEIWEMLRPKMEKNEFHSYVCRVFNYELERYERTEFYIPKDFQKAVALAYKMGYERAMKGRPFKYGEKKAKKVGGHWEKVDPENLPKDGTRVRYARLDAEYGDDPDWIRLGDEGVVVHNNSFPDDFAMRPDIDRGWDWLGFNGAEDSLDYWVEGDDAD